jgi:hypothetical protein
MMRGMYMPMILISIIYGLRVGVFYFAPSNLQLRKFLVFLLIMLSLVLLIGSITGHTRWNLFRQHGLLATAEIIHKGRCAEFPYVEGPYRRPVKRLYLVDLKKYNPNYNPFQPIGAHGEEGFCVGYRFKPNGEQVAYASEFVKSKDFPDNMQGRVQVRFYPHFIEHNWLETYVMEEAQDGTMRIIFYSLALIEAFFHGYIYGIRFRKVEKP